MTTIKTLAAIALLAQSTPALASTPVTIDFDRWEAISAASERICPAATRAPDAAAHRASGQEPDAS